MPDAKALPWNGDSPEEMVKKNICPRCLGELDTGWECNKCGYDAIALVKREADRGR